MAQLEAETLHVIQDMEGLDRLDAYLDDWEFVAFDCETTGLERNAKVVGWSVAAEPDLGWYVLLAWWDPVAKVLEEASDEFKARAIQILQKLQTKKLVMHNGQVDVNWTRVNFDVDLWEAWHTDTLPLAHLLDEDRPTGNGLKELGAILFGENARYEADQMKASVIERGGVWEDKRGGNKEMYKCEPILFGRYGAKDTILTLKLFHAFIPQLFAEKLDAFFYDDEVMPLFKTVTYDMNMTGLRVDLAKLQAIEKELTEETDRLRGEVLREVLPYVKEKYPCTNKKNTFNVGSGQQLSWLLFMRLGNEWKKVTKAGRVLSKDLMGKIPYNPSGRRTFMRLVTEAGMKPEKFIQCDKKALANLAGKYSWVIKILEYRKAKTLLKTYAIGMQKFVKYGVVHPSFLQHGTTSGRYSSSKPNFQNLPRDDKRIKSCVLAREGKILVAADYSQLEPRVFTAMSQDPILMAGFKKNEDFYSVVGIPVFNMWDCSANKKDPNWLGRPAKEGGKYEHFRQAAKVIALSLAYGTTAYKLSDELRDESGQNLSVDRCQEIRDGYFETYKGVKKFVDESHLQIVTKGVVYNLFGRPRRLPTARVIKQMGFPKVTKATDLPYLYRTFLNLAVNHRVQSTAASVVNRAAVAFWKAVKEMSVEDPRWLEVIIVLQVHDEIVVECPESMGAEVAELLRDCMENTVLLPGVDLIAEPKIGRTLAECK